MSNEAEQVTGQTYTHEEVLAWIERERDAALGELATQGIGGFTGYLMYVTFAGLINSWELEALPPNTPEVILALITEGAAHDAVTEGKARYGL